MFSESAMQLLFGVTFFLVASSVSSLPPTLNQNGTKPTRSQCSMYPHFDITPGTDLASFRTADVTSCCNECDLHILCRGWTYEVESSLSNNCFLKTSTDLVPTTKDAIAGISSLNNAFQVQLFDNYEWEGIGTSVTLSNTVPCYNVSLSSSISSIRTNGYCVRLYSGANCLGYSRTLVDRESNHNLNLIGFDNFKGSLGKCLLDDVCEVEEYDDGFCPAEKEISVLELSQNSDVDSNLREDIFGKKCDPLRHRFHHFEVIYFGYRLIERLVNLTTSTNPIRQYERGLGGRTEYLRAEIWYRHLNTGTPTNDASRNYIRSLGGYYNNPDRCDDDAGHIIGQSLGGSGTAEYNLFPQNRNVNRGLWSQIERLVRENLRADTGRYVILEISFFFGVTSNRATGFWYRIVLTDGTVIEDTIENYENGREQLDHHCPGGHCVYD